MRLAAGPLSATLDGLALRWLCWHGVELLRGVAFVVRDPQWGTFQPSVEWQADAADAEYARLRARATVATAAAQLACELKVTASPTRVVLLGRATAGGDFATNRTGFVVLHGEGCVAQPVTVEHTDGRVVAASFPDLISPHQPFMDLRAVSHTPYPGLRVSVAMAGEAFEMEDHRNWSDPGFKTYCRPLAAPRPFVIPDGTTLEQAITIDVDAAAAVLPSTPAAQPVAAGPPRPQVRVVRGAPAAGFPSGPYATGSLLAETRDGQDLDGFARALAAGHPGAVLLHGAEGREAALDAIAALPHLEALLIAGATPADIVHARRRLPGVRLGAGSATNFAELNRMVLPGGIDFMFWAVSATVHAADDASVLETLRVLPDQARTAKARWPGLPFWVGPIGIGASWTPDPREAGPLGAAFHLGHLAAWTEAGAEAVIVPFAATLPP